MAKKRSPGVNQGKSLLEVKTSDAQMSATKGCVHVYRNKVRCETDDRGHVTPGNQDPARLVLHAPGGVISLWAPNVTLRWRFKQSSLDAFQNPAAVKASVEALLTKALLLWGDAVPVKFREATDNVDFQFVVRTQEDCDVNGCVLASAFFPDQGRHEFVMYPTMFEQSEQEQIETFCHELGHVFGLRHFFAQKFETGIPSEIFGKHSKTSIMNYGEDSKLTDDDRADLKRLYEGVWSGEITKINDVPVRLVRPFSSLAALEDGSASFGGLGSVGIHPSLSAQLGCSPVTRIVTKEVFYARR